MLMCSLRKVSTKEDRSSERYALLKRLFGIAGELFPHIEFRIEEALFSFHAQAYVFGGRQTVSLLGGLAFHMHLQKDGLLLTILHEIGHHVAPGPRLTRIDVLSCDCAADRWAVTEGRRLFALHGVTLDVQEALSEIELALAGVSPPYNLEAGRWCFDWQRRKSDLTDVPMSQLTDCEFLLLCTE
jgi:hypothetical protein